MMILFEELTAILDETHSSTPPLKVGYIAVKNRETGEVCYFQFLRRGTALALSVAGTKVNIETGL